MPEAAIYKVNNESKRGIKMKVLITNSTMDEKRSFIRSLVEDAGSRFLSVEFKKADGTLRRMTIQQESLKAHVKGDKATSAGKQAVATRKANYPNLLPVWDHENQAVRSINLDTTVAVRSGKSEYVFG
jgi:hypothetical protein